MRVIAGVAKGRRLRAPRGARPTTDRVKEALFSSLAPRLPGARVLDLFAGSGALAIEALSRGADHAVLVDRARAAGEVMRANLDVAGLAQHAEVVTAEVDATVRARDAAGDRFDIVLLDPPYATAPSQLTTTLRLVAPLVAPSGVVVVETATRSAALELPSALLTDRTRRYGDTTLIFAVPSASGPT